MNYFRMRDTGAVVSETQYREAHEQVFPVPLVPEDADAVLQSPAPSCSEHQYCIQNGVKQDSKGNWIWDWDIITMSDAEITTYENAKAVSTTAAVASKIDSLWNAANNYITGYISGTALTILAIGIMKNKPKALAVKQWSDAIWAEYYNRKDSISATSNVDYSFTSFGNIPYSVPELLVEANS